MSSVSNSENVIDYSMAKHGMLVDEIIPIFRLTGVREEDSYKIYYDTTEKRNDWHTEYTSFCNASGGKTVNTRYNNSPINCTKDGEVLFSWLYGSKRDGYNTGSRQEGMLEYKYKVENHLRYFLVLMPKKTGLEVDYIESRLFSYANRIR